MRYKDADPYQDLANAIIIQAAKDYRSVRKRLTKRPNDKWLEGELKKLERFFLSPWCEMLSEVDGTYILRRLREEGDK